MHFCVLLVALLTAVDGISSGFGSKFVGLFVLPKWSTRKNFKSTQMVDFPVFPPVNVQSYVHNLLSDMSASPSSSLESFLSFINGTYPKFCPEYNTVVQNFFAVQNIRDLNTSTLIYITRRIAFAESFHCGLGHRPLFDGLFDNVVGRDDLSPSQLSIFLHSLVLTKYRILHDYRIERLIKVLTRLVPAMDTSTLSFVLKSVREMAVERLLQNKALMQCVVEKLQNPTPSYAKTALRTVTYLRRRDLDFGVHFNTRVIISFLNNIDWSVSESITLDLLLNGLHGICELEVKYSDCNETFQKGISKLVEDSILRMYNSQNLFRALEKLMDFGFAWTYINESCKENVLRLIQCKAALDDLRWETTLGTYVRIGIDPDRWNPLFTRKMYELAEFFKHPDALKIQDQSTSKVGY